MQRCSDGIEVKPMDIEEAQQIAEFLKVFGDPDRVRILALLKDKEMCVGHIAEALSKTVSAVSHQLGIMRRQRLVRYVKDGKNIFYTVDDAHVSMLLDAAQEHCRHK